MNWENIASTVGKVAPGLGSLLAGNAGEAVGNWLAGLLGVEPKPEKVDELLKSDPDSYVKLKEIEANSLSQAREVALQELELRLEDRQDARKRSNKFIELTGHVDYFQLFVGVVITVSVPVALTLLIFVGLEPTVKDAVLIVLGAMVSQSKELSGYLFGSSKVSDDNQREHKNA